MACIAATLFGLVVGVPSIRTKGIYLAIVTLVMAETVMLIMLKGGRTTGGDEGLLQIPSLFSNVRSYYYLAFLTLIVLSVVFEKIMMSKYGIAFRAIAGDELAARSLGVEANKYRLLAFVLSAGFGGISGAIFAHYTGTITPDIFSIATLNLVLSMAIIGGAGTAMGSIIGSFLIVFLEEFFRFTVDYRFVIINIIMIACILYVPKGIWGLIKWKLFRKLRA
jgi:branched-chain amino acid transport system permease protein